MKYGGEAEDSTPPKGPWLPLLASIVWCRVVNFGDRTLTTWDARWRDDDDDDNDNDDD